MLNTYQGIEIDNGELFGTQRPLGLIQLAAVLQLIPDRSSAAVPCGHLERDISAAHQANILTKPPDAMQMAFALS